jgi:hypothetical protein
VSDLNSRGEGGGAAIAGDGGDAVLTRFEELGDETRGETTGCLMKLALRIE